MQFRKRKPKPKHEYTDAARGERLQKVLASAGVASRRACELLITEGAVKVNGAIVRELPAWVDADRDRIEVDGRPIARHRKSTASVGKQGHVYVVLHKPREVISTTSDDLGRKGVTDLVDLPPLHPGDPPPRLFPVGRLDADSTGLILLTNDGDLAHRLTHPSYEIPKEYEVSVSGTLTDADIKKLTQGMKLWRREGGARRPAGKKTATVEARIMGHQRDDSKGNRTALHLTMHEGQVREIRLLLSHMGFKVRRLKRTSIGPLRLKGLALRQWRMLSSAEVNQLRREVGLGKQ